MNGPNSGLFAVRMSAVQGHPFRQIIRAAPGSQRVKPQGRGKGLCCASRHAIAEVQIQVY